MIRDLSDDEARAAMVLKWGTVPPDVLPSWVAEMDFAIAPVISEALAGAVARGVTGYPADNPALGAVTRLGTSYAAFAERRLGWRVAPERVIPTADVTTGVRLAIDVLSEPGGVVLPLPAYHPQLDVMALTGRERVDLPTDPDAERAEIDLDRLDAAFAAGARTLLLTQPHNPCGHVYTRAELEGVRDVVLRHGARVVSDEIWGPLVLPGARHVPYLSLDGTADHAVAVVAASKAFNVPGLKCAQLVTASPDTARRLGGVPLVANDSWSPLGVIAAIAAYDAGEPWLDALVTRLDEQRTLLASLLAAELPLARMRPMEATYVAWLDLRAYGHDDPAAVALERGRVKLAPGHDYHPGLPGHVRLNLATSPDRLTEIVRRLAVAFGG